MVWNQVLTFMNKAKGAETQSVVLQMRTAQSRLSEAEVALETTKERSREAKRKRKEAKQAAREARKEVKRAKTELAEAKRAVAAAKVKLAESRRVSAARSEESPSDSKTQSPKRRRTAKRDGGEVAPTAAPSPSSQWKSEKKVPSRARIRRTKNESSAPIKEAVDASEERKPVAESAPPASPGSESAKPQDTAGVGFAQPLSLERGETVLQPNDEL